MQKNLGLSLMVASLVTIYCAGEPSGPGQYVLILAVSCLLGTAGYFLWKGSQYIDVPEYIDPETGEVYYGFSSRKLLVELAVKLVVKAYHRLKLPVAFLLFAVSMMVFYWKLLA